MMKKLKYKRILASILLLVTMLSVAQPIFAASGTGEWVGGQYASYIKTTDNANTEYGIIIRKLINYNTGEKRTVFCAEHGVDFKTDVVYNGSYYTPVKADVRKACKIAYLGWYKDKGNYVVDGGISNADKKQYVLVQQYIWEVLGQTNARFLDSGIQAEFQLENAKQEIQKEFPKEQELKEKLQKLDQINAELKINDNDHEMLGDEQEEKEEIQTNKKAPERC